MERVTLAEVIEDWNSAHAKATGIMLQARRWELDATPALGERPQALINKQLVDDADILLAVFSARLGSHTGFALSGTVEEIERLRDMNKTVSVYFSKAPLPRGHDPEQLRMLTEYKQELSRKGLYFEFEDEGDLRRLASRHLASTMSGKTSVEQNKIATKVASAVVSLVIGKKGKSGDVRTVEVEWYLENLSPVKRITEYMATFSVPNACLTFASTTYRGQIEQPFRMDEIHRGSEKRRFFRTTESTSGVILPGEKIRLFSFELGVDQLKMTGTYLAGDFEGTLADSISSEVVVNEEVLRSKTSISSIFDGIV